MTEQNPQRERRIRKKRRSINAPEHAHNRSLSYGLNHVQQPTQLDVQHRSQNGGTQFFLAPGTWRMFN